MWCGDFIAKEKLKDSYLGDIFEAGSNLGQAREGKIKSAIHGLVTIVEDGRSDVIGGFKVAISLT